MGKLRDFFEAVVGFAAGSTLVGLVLGTVPLTKVVSTFIGAVQQNFLYFGLSYITSKGSEDTAQRNLGIKTAVTNPVAPRNVVYGKTRVGGTIVQRTVSSKSGSTSQNVLHHVIAVAGHEINNITKVFIDGGKGTVELDLSSDFTSATENSTTVFRCTNSDFVNADNTDAYTGGSLIKLAFEKGDQTAANAYAVAQIPSSNWTTDHKMLGIAFVYVNCIYDSEKFTAIPTFSFEVEGKKVFDPVSSSTVYSTNPALIIRDYLMDSTYGFGAVADEINDAASGAGFVQARSDCNDSVSITGGSESRFTLNGEFVATEEPQRVLETMLSACAGQLLYNNGKFSLFVGKGRTASGTITDDKILAPIQIQTKASGKDLVNGVKATYVRPDDKYIAGEITPYKDSTFLTEDTPTGKASADYENFLDLAFPYTQSTFTAQRLARIALNYERQDQTLSVLVPLDFLSHQVGDIVNLDNDRLGYSGKDFEIIGMSFEFLNDQYLALRLSLKEYSSTIFDFFTYVADPTLPSEPPSGDNTVGSPTGLALAEFIKESQMRLHFIRASWTNNLDDKIIATEVAYKKSSDSNFDTASVNYPSALFSFYVEPATTYNVKVRHITATGVRSDFTGTVNITTSADRATLTDGTIGGITIESGKLYQGTGTFNNSNTGFYIDSSGQFSLKDKLSFNGTTLNISGNLTVENTISADKIVVGGITLDNLISASDQASSNYLTTFAGAVKIASGGASAGYPAELQIQATEHTNAIGTLQQSQSQLTIRARNNTSNGGIAFQGFNGTTPTNYGNFDASGNLNLEQNLVVNGDLTVSGTTTTVDTTNTNVKDNNLTLNYSTGDSSSTANGAGLTIQDAVSASTDATILWDSTNDEFDFSHGINISGSSNFNNALTIQGTTTFNDDAIFVNDALFGDNDKAIFGAGSDLQIYHDGGNSLIQDTGTGDLILKSNGTATVIKTNAGNNLISARDAGSVGVFHDGSEKLTTASTGIDVTGIVKATANGSDEKHLRLVDSANTSITGAIYHDNGIMSIESGNNTAFGQIVFKRQATGGTAESARFDASGRLLVNKSSATGSLNLEVQAPSGFSVGSGFYSASTQSTIDFKDTNTTANYKVRIGSETDDLVMFAGGSKRVTINSSGNATFTGTISSGAITTSGLLTVGSGAGAIKINESFITARSSDNANDINLIANINVFDADDVVIGSTSGQRFNDNIVFRTNGSQALRLDSSQNATFAGNIEGSLIKATDQFQSISGSRTLVMNANFSGLGAIGMSSNDHLTFVTNNTERMRLDNSGRLGIGTTSVTNALGWGSIAQIGGANPALSLRNSSSNQWDIANFGGTFNIYNGSNARLKIDSSGNVGIGTNSPSHKLDVVGGGLEITEEETTDAIALLDSSNSNTKYLSIQGDNGDCNINAPAGGLVLQTSGSSRATVGSAGISIASLGNGIQLSRSGFDTYAFEHSAGVGMAILNVTDSRKEMFFKGDGSIGIGTTSPDNVLHVQEAALSGRSASNGNTSLTLEHSTDTGIQFFSATQTQLRFGDAASTGAGSIIYTHSDNILRFEASSAHRFTIGGSEKMRVDPDGDILFGVTSDPSSSNAGAAFTAETGNRMLLKLATTATSLDTLAEIINGNGTVGTIRTTGSSTQFNTSSDARLKNVTGYARGLKVINRLNPVAYNWKADGKAGEGLIAQEVQDLVPDAVSGSEEDMYQMDYSKLVVHLVKGMQEQQEQIEKLQADSHSPKGLEDMDGYKDLLSVIEKLQEEVKLLKGVN